MLNFYNRKSNQNFFTEKNFISSNDDSNSKQPPVNQKKNWLMIALTVGLVLLILAFFLGYFSNNTKVFTADELEDFINKNKHNINFGASSASSYVDKGLFYINIILKVNGQNTHILVFSIITDNDTFYDVSEFLSKNNITITPKSTTFFDAILNFLPSLIVTLIICFALYYLLKISMKGKGIDFGYSKSRAIISSSTIKYRDIAGYDEEKTELIEFIDILKNPKKYQEMGVNTPKGILLVGPPGTGKTMLAKAVAGEATVPMYTISGSNFVELFVGVGAARVRDLFKVAKKSAPCVIFIDEIDAIGKSRGANMMGGNDEREQALNQLLIEIDGFSPNNGIIVIGATNRADVLDPALTRPGRFNRKITVHLPNFNERIAILKIYAENKNVDPLVNFEDIARITSGFSGAQLAEIMNDAGLLTARASKLTITEDEIYEAIDRVIGGIRKRSRKYDDLDKKIVSYHETGHALTGLVLKTDEIIQKITIIPRNLIGGYTLIAPAKELFWYTKQKLNDKIAILLSGRIAEEIEFGSENITNGAKDDIEKATKIAREMVTALGMSKLGPIQFEEENNSPYAIYQGQTVQRNYSSETFLKIENEIKYIIESNYNRAKKILLENKELLDLIANELYKKETLLYEEITFLFNEKKPLPEKEKVSVENLMPVVEKVISVTNENEEKIAKKTEVKKNFSFKSLPKNFEDLNKDKNGKIKDKNNKKLLKEKKSLSKDDKKENE
ncbi:ATP-dependent zinc metalloprotease FtsH [symbiont of Argiope bruennichi]|uniref:ATP-dependent zinc metalloprotease FtsH n=1 Tax=symbiont of Argiope bruennichi TaxID=2810479 RepID=UPI003DA4681B